MNPSISTLRRLSLPFAAGVVIVLGILLGAFGRSNHALAAANRIAALGVCTINWTGTAGDNQWTTASNWNPVRVPGSSDFACVPSTSTQSVIISAGTNIVKGLNSQGSGLSVTTGSLELTDTTQSSAIKALSLSGSTFTVDSGVSLALAGNSSWSGGDITGSGTTTVASGASLDVAVGGNGAQLHGGHTLANQGTVNWVGGYFCLYEGAVITNNNLAHFNVQADGYYMYFCGGTGGVSRFHNLSGGILARNGTSATINYISVPFDNDGTVQLTSGDLEVGGDNSSGASDSGAYSLASSTHLRLNGTARTFGASATVSGAGVLDLLGGTTTFTGTSIPNMTQSAGTATGSFTITGTDSWTGGDLTGSGTTTIASGGTLNVNVGGTGALLHGGHTLANQGTVNWVGGYFCLYEGAVINNQNLGQFNVQADGYAMYDCGGLLGVSQFVNAASGIVTRSGSNVVSISVPFTNNGTLKLSSGILQISGNYSQPSSATFTTVIGGATPGSGFGQLQIAGTGTLGGHLVLINAGGFTPSVGQEFQVITCGTSCTGSFATISGTYSVRYDPNDVTVVAANPISTVSKLQYQLANSNGTSWVDMDPNGLRLSFTPGVDSVALLSGNSDLWTANAGYNQDIGVAVSGGTYPTSSGQPEAWKESGGFAGTFSPNAAYVQTAIPVSGGTTYTAKLQWKTNKNAPGVTIYAGAGPINAVFSPTRLTVQLVPTSTASVTNKNSTLQYHLMSSNGTTWQDMDGTNLSATITPAADSVAWIGGNADLWTASAGYNQDVGITISGGAFPTTAGQPEAWKESGGFAGTFSPNAAMAQTVVPLTHGVTYTVKLQWKTNKNAPGGTIYAGAGPIGGKFSPSSLIVQLFPAGANPYKAISSAQYHLTGSDGATWQNIDATNLSLSVTPTSTCLATVSGNADLWTANAGYNQDLGIAVTGGSFPSTVGQPEAWKESGGFAGNFSPNAAYVQTVLQLNGGTTYTFRLQWKANKDAAGATIYAGAGPINTKFSPTSLTVQLSC